jgi:hypothetical protein
LFAFLGTRTFLTLEPKQEPVQIPLIDFQAVLRLIPNMQLVRIEVELDGFSETHERTVHGQVD